jgi:hypothetical protein
MMNCVGCANPFVPPGCLAPVEVLARPVLADPMVRSPLDRAERICHDIGRFGAEAVVVSSLLFTLHASHVLCRH